MRGFRKLFLLATITCCLVITWSTETLAQLPTTETVAVESLSLAETRELDVVLPIGYERDPARRYPVMVVIDGNFMAFAASATADWLAQVNEMPEFIVVGVRSTDRRRDLTPPPTGAFAERIDPERGPVGWADRFLEFIHTEVLPEIDSRYRTQPFRVLVGHSLGGLFTTYTLAQAGNAFTAFLAIDAALGWNERQPVVDAIAALRANPRLRYSTVQVGLGVTEEEWALMREASPAQPGERIEIDNENHRTVPLRAMREGFRTLFADYPTPPRPEGGAPVQHLVDHYSTLAENLGYPVYLGPAKLLAALRQSLDARNEVDARLGAAVLEQRHPSHPALPEVRRALDAVFGQS
jgi:predicted alpha/beta superfamily hydrolase